MNLQRITCYPAGVTREGEIIGTAQSGYDLPGSGWTPYRVRGATPASFLVIRWQGQTKSVFVNRRTILRIE